MVFGIIMFVLGMIGAITSFVLAMIRTRKIVKNPTSYIDYKSEFKNLLILGGIGTISFTISIGFIYLWAQITPKFYEVLFAVICSLLFYASLFTFYVTFRLHYYRTDIDKTIDKKLFTIYCISIPVGIISLFYSFNGFAEYMTYPLPNGVSFTEGIKYLNPFTSGIAFYAICILCGALLAYAISDHKMYQQYGKHGTLDSTFFIAFPAGIIGARIWYVIGEWKTGGFAENPITIFQIWNGGLTILGGALTGIVVGVLWFMWRNKKYSIWIAVDMVVPTILIAQAIGRLGNFFNVEVHGNPVDAKYFCFLPQIILKNGMFSSENVSLEGTGKIYLPLFLIEALINIGGYFLLSELFGKKLRKYTELGDIAIGYVVFYGLVRVILEPLRDASFNMGEGGYWSWVNSTLFVIVGMLLILFNHLIRYLIRKKKGENKAVSKWEKLCKTLVILISCIGGVFLSCGIVTMTLNKIDLSTVSYNMFNFGVVLLVIGLGVLISVSIPIIYLQEIKSQRSKDTVGGGANEKI